MKQLLRYAGLIAGASLLTAGFDPGQRRVDMSSARKRAAIQKANNEADNLRQRLMLAENHINILRAMAEAIGRGSDVMHAALTMIEAQAVAIGTNECSRLAKNALAEVGAGNTAALMGSNEQAQGAGGGLIAGGSAGTAGCAAKPTE